MTLVRYSRAAFVIPQRFDLATSLDSHSHDECCGYIKEAGGDVCHVLRRNICPVYTGFALMMYRTQVVCATRAASALLDLYYPHDRLHATYFWRGVWRPV